MREQNQRKEVELKRMATERIADKRRMFEFFTEIKDQVKVRPIFA